MRIHFLSNKAYVLEMDLKMETVEKKAVYCEIDTLNL